MLEATGQVRLVPSFKKNRKRKREAESNKDPPLLVIEGGAEPSEKKVFGLDEVVRNYSEYFRSRNGRTRLEY